MKYDKIMQQDEDEIERLKRILKEEAERLLNEFGPEGACELSYLLEESARFDMHNRDEK